MLDGKQYVILREADVLAVMDRSRGGGGARGVYDKRRGCGLGHHRQANAWLGTLLLGEFIPQNWTSISCAFLRWRQWLQTKSSPNLPEAYIELLNGYGHASRIRASTSIAPADVETLQRLNTELNRAITKLKLKVPGK